MTRIKPVAKNSSGPIPKSEFKWENIQKKIAKNPFVINTQSTHKLLAVIYLASQILVQEADKCQLDKLVEGFNMLEPIKATIITPALDVEGSFAEQGMPAIILTNYLSEHDIIVEKCGLYSFFIMFTIGIAKGRWKTLVTEFQQFKGCCDTNSHC